jgi:hypothetical protein
MSADVARAALGFATGCSGAVLFVQGWKRVALCNCVISLVSVLVYCHLFSASVHKCIEDVMRG